MWSAPIQDRDFIDKVLEHLEGNQDKYGTATRMKGMLTVAKEVHMNIYKARYLFTNPTDPHNKELDTTFYFTPARLAGNFHCECPPLDEVA